MLADKGSSMFTRRGFLRAMGLNIGGVAVPAVVIGDEQRSVGKSPHVNGDGEWTHHMVFCDRSGAQKYYANGERVVSFADGSTAVIDGDEWGVIRRVDKPKPTWFSEGWIGR